ncbi:unnamed protein product [Penicillium nalgiovense]|nr:unnamed protein product [Penicillium nalgiovense]
MHFFLRSRWRLGAQMPDHDNISIDDEEGENMVGMNMDSERRQEQRRRDTLAETEGRLSRDLEEGFMDDSDEEGNEEPRNGRGGRL